jgi:carbon-monoxide dehydrogenase medium subunit
MLSSDFQFFVPTELPEALALLAEHSDGGKVLAGGMSMVPTVNLGLLRPSAVVSLNHVSGLAAVEDDGDAIRIGAMVRHERIASDELIRTHLPLLSEAARVIGDVQVRNRGTIGGSIAHADPAADYLPAVCALDATVTLASSTGERTVKARDFFVDVMLTALQPAEVLVGIRVPKIPEGAGSAYVRLARVEGSFALVNAAAVVADRHAVIAIGGAVPTPVVLELGLGDGPAEEVLDGVASAAVEACADAYGDLNGSEEYRRRMAGLYARRAVEQALATRKETTR